MSGGVPRGILTYVGRKHESGVTLIEILVGIVFLILAVALLVPAFSRASRQEKVEACAANLKALHAAQLSHYAASTVPPELGRAYWEALTKTTPPLVQPQTLICPLSEYDPPVPVQYLGPASDPRKAGAADPIGCDLESNHASHGHQGGNILLNSGVVVNDYAREGGLWGAVQSKYCRP